MLKRTRKFVLWLLLACMPLQSIAALADLPCCGEPDERTNQSAPEAPCHNDAADQPTVDQPQDRQTGTHGCAAMDCGHHCFSVIPGVARSTPVYQATAYERRLPASFQSFFPERPKRPPQASA